MTIPAYTRSFWAKSDRDNPQRIHLLEHHMADVGACLEALLAQPTIRRRLARSGGRDDLDPATVARLCVFAALHDIGKVNIGFQARIWEPERLPKGDKIPWAGHIADLAPVLCKRDRQTAKWFLSALQWNEIEEWDDTDGDTVCGLFLASLSHHGRPFQLDDPTKDKFPRLWQPLEQLDPQEFVERVGQLIRHWFPQAFRHDACPLPSVPSFQHHFLGLCNLADWVGSNESWFQYVDTPDDDYICKARKKAGDAINAIGLNVNQQRADFGDVPEFSKLFAIPGSAPPNAIQRAVAETPLREQLLIIESETGSGKTEAVLWRFARMYEAELVDGLYFALPTRAAAVQIHKRVCKFVGNLFPETERPEPVLAVPGYVRAGSVSGKHLPHYKVLWDDGAANDSRWAAENPKQFLAAQIAVGTVDQAMLGVLRVKNAHLRTSCLARNLLVVDEVHASDPYMSVILQALLDAHIGTGGYAVLMSATLGSAARRRWLYCNRRFDQNPPPLNEAVAAPYPSVSVLSNCGETLTPAGENGQEKNIAIEAIPEMTNFPATVHRALDAARAGAKVLVVRNTVDYAIRTLEALEKLAIPDDSKLLFSVNRIVTLHHGRFAAEDRQLLDQQIDTALGKGRKTGGHIVVGTQTLEQSLDIDADLLISDLCPVDVLLQRIGRLHRHRDNNHSRPAGYQLPRCIVLTPLDHDLALLLRSGKDANGLGPKGYVYEDLRILEATRKLIDERSGWQIPQINRELVERATHPHVLSSIAQEKGQDWITHAKRLLGEEFAERGHARSAYISRDKSFCSDNHDVLFHPDEKRIRTRLGDDRIDIVLKPQAASPFDSGIPIDKIALSIRWLQQGHRVPESVEAVASEGGFDFSVGDRKFRYDRKGLRRA